MSQVNRYSFSKAVIGNEMKEDVSIGISGRKIKSIDEPDRNSVDLTGYIAVPAFIDIHTHGIMGIDTGNINREEIHIWRETLLRFGTSGFVPTLVSSPTKIVRSFLTIVNDSIKEDREDFSKSDLLGARLEGPFISPEKRGAHDVKNIIFPSVENFRKLTGLLWNLVKIIDIAPETEGAMGLIEYLRSLNITVSIGHSNATSMIAANAIDRGASLATHLFNAMREIHHRDPGIAAQVLLNNKISAEIINDRNHLSDEFIRIAVRMKGSDRIIGITDSISATGMQDGDYRLGNEIATLRNGVCTIKGTNTLAGSVLTMDAALRNFRSLGYKLNSIVRFLSTNPARILGLKDFGTIGIGKNACIAILNSDYTVRGMIHHGKLLEF